MSAGARTAPPPSTGLPAGYERFAVGEAEVVALADATDAVREALHEGTLYAYAEPQTGGELFARVAEHRRIYAAAA